MSDAHLVRAGRLFLDRFKQRQDPNIQSALIQASEIFERALEGQAGLLKILADNVVVMAEDGETWCRYCQAGPNEKGEIHIDAGEPEDEQTAEMFAHTETCPLFGYTAPSCPHDCVAGVMWEKASDFPDNTKPCPIHGEKGTPAQ